MQQQPLAAPVAPDPSAGASVARHVILDGRSAIYAYELVDGSNAPPSRARDAELLAHAIALTASKTLAERRQIFVRCAFSTLASEHIALVDPEHVVLDVTLPAVMDAGAIHAAAQTLAELRQRGFRLAFSHEVLASTWRSWLAHAGYIKLDLARLPAAALPGLVKVARLSPARLIATSVNDPEQHRVATSLGLDLFQGPWFAQPILLKSQTMRPNQAIILELIAMLRREADTVEIETLLKRDPALSFNLLRFINSGAFGLTGEVTSFRSAVLMVGLQRLLRWATLLMATSRDGAPALGQTAVVRGRLMELLAAELLTPEQCDQAFVVGVFSLLDAMTGIPMARALEGLSLPDGVTDALLHRRGLYEPFLALTEACEGANDEAFARNADRLLLSGHAVNMAHLQALAWAEDLLAG